MGQVNLYLQIHASGIKEMLMHPCIIVNILFFSGKLYRQRSNIIQEFRKLNLLGSSLQAERRKRRAKELKKLRR